MDEITKPVGRSKSGHARAASLSPEKRAEIAVKAAKARWDILPSDTENLPAVISGSPDRPLVIGATKIPCYVLNDKRRVLVQRGLQTSIGMSTSGGSDGAQRLAIFIEGLAKKGVDCNDLALRIREPILFRPSSSGRAYGYEATIINDICDAVLEARLIKGALAPQQVKFAKQCEILVRGLARVGILELVDRATGYDKIRARENLEEILEKFIAKDLQKYVKTFPIAYYEEIFRLNNWTWDSVSGKRPGIVGTWTNDIIYARLAPGILAELRKRTPKDDKGKFKTKLFRKLTPDHGHPKLVDHISNVLTLMRAARSWKEFYVLLDRSIPRFGDTLQLPFDDAQSMEKVDQKTLVSPRVTNPSPTALPPPS